MDPRLKPNITQCKSINEIAVLLRETNIMEMSRGDVELIFRRIQKCGLQPQIKMAYLSNYTIEPLRSYISVFCAQEGIFVSDFIERYNQYFQAIINTQSDLISFDPHIIFLALSIRELAPKIYNEFGALSIEERKHELDRILSHLIDWITLAKKNTKANIILSNFCSPAFAHNGIADLKQSYSESEFYVELNLEILKLFKNDLRVFIFDLDKVNSNYGKRKAKNNKFYYLAKMEWNDKFFPFIAGELIRYIKAIKNMAKKCLVLDLDNTLWGGIVGEDGPGEIKIGKGDPEGEAYLDFQYAVRSLKDRGIILSVCSKNNREDVLEVFEKRTEMPLKLHDFAVMEINWEAKHVNLAKIAATLNIGTDSLVFIDDSPVECSLIREMMPEVKIIQLPRDPSEYTDILWQINDFEKLLITEEDKNKADQYIQNARRIVYRQEIGDFKSFLNSLDTKIVIKTATISAISRIHQLFNKTNQFNLTTKSYIIGEIETFINDDRYDLKLIEAMDRFGNLGIIGLYLIDLRGSCPIIDSFILSCRVMGREIETSVMNVIKTDCFMDRTYTRIESSYIPTSKNKPVEFFYESQGFCLAEKLEDGKKLYYLKSNEANIIDCPWIKIERMRSL